MQKLLVAPNACGVALPRVGFDSENSHPGLFSPLRVTRLLFVLQESLEAPVMRRYAACSQGFHEIQRNSVAVSFLRLRCQVFLD